MTSLKIFIDTNIFIYAAGRPHPHKEPSAKLLKQIAQGEAQGLSSVEVGQELLYRYWHIKMPEAGFQIMDYFLEIMGPVLPVVKPDISLAKRLMQEHGRLPPRDAIHAAVMLNHAITRIYSYDRHFDLIEEIKRLEP